MATTPAARRPLTRTPPASLPYKLEIDQLKRQLALVAGGTDAAELTALLATTEDDVARLVRENAALRNGQPPTPDSDAEAAVEILEGELATEQAARERAERALAELRAASVNDTRIAEREQAARARAEKDLAELRTASANELLVAELATERAARARAEKDLDELRTERDAMQARRERAEKDLDELRTSSPHEALVAERDAARRQAEALGRQVAAQILKASQLKKQLKPGSGVDTLKRALKTLEGERDALRQAVAGLEADLRREALKRTKDAKADAHVAEAEERTATAVKARDEAREERDALVAAVEAAEERLAEASEAPTARATKERDEARLESVALVTAVEAAEDRCDKACQERHALVTAVEAAEARADTNEAAHAARETQLSKALSAARKDVAAAHAAREAADQLSRRSTPNSKVAAQVARAVAAAEARGRLACQGAAQAARTGADAQGRRIAAEARQLADAVMRDRAQSDAALADCRRRVARERALRFAAAEAAAAAFDAAKGAGADRAARDAARGALADAEEASVALRREAAAARQAAALSEAEAGAARDEADALHRKLAAASQRQTALNGAEHELGKVVGEVARLQAACRDALGREAAQRRAADRAELRLEASRREHFKLREDFRRLRMAALARGTETPARALGDARTAVANSEAARERLPGYTPPPGSAALASRSPFRNLHNGATPAPTPTPWKRTPRRAAPPSTGRSRISM
jgi:ParB family chromosome partitioning protein